MLTWTASYCGCSSKKVTHPFHGNFDYLGIGGTDLAAVFVVVILARHDPLAADECIIFRMCLCEFIRR